MKVYLIYERDGWEIHGIEKCFDSKEKAISYLEQYRQRVNLVRPSLNFDEYVEGEIIEVTVT